MFLDSVPEFEEENFTFLPANQQPPASTTSGQLLQSEPEVETEQSNGTRDAIPLVDTVNATQQRMVPAAHKHDEQRQPERIMQEDTGETTQNDENPVSKPQSVPSTAEKPRDIPSTESTENQQNPANSTHSADLGIPMQ